MKLIFYVTLCLFLCNFSVDSIANGFANELEKVNYVTQPSRERVQEESLLSSIARFIGRRGSTVNDNKTKFTNLNIDCLLLILEYLDFDDLLNVAQINDKFSTLAADVFHRKYSHLQIVIRDNFPMPSEPYELLNVAGVKINTDTFGQVFKHFWSDINEIPTKHITKISKTEIEIEDYGQLMNTFRHFGHVIKKIKTDTNSWILSSQSELIGTLISKYSSESLVDVEFLDNNTEKLLDHLTKPLISVKNVTFRDRVMRFNQTVRFDHLFPAVRRLNFEFRLVFPHSYHHMPHLEHVSIQGTTQYDHSPYLDLIRKNPQIRSIDLVHAAPEFLQNVSILLPQLETLALEFFELENGSIRFENVTTFRVDLGYHTSPKNLHFPRLQTLQVDYKSTNFAKWLEFVNEHNQLRNLHLTYYDMDDSQFQQLTANLTDLVELTLRRHTNPYETDRLSADHIWEFLRSHDKLKQLNVIGFPEYHNLALRTLTHQEWDSTIIDGGLSFERKINT